MLRAFGHPVATCCDMLGVAGLNLKMVNFHATFVAVARCCSLFGQVRATIICAQACKLVRFSTPNMSQHVATGWPNAFNMLCPTM